MGLSAIDRRHRTAWTYYWLTSAARGRGYAVRALATIAAAAFEDDLFRLELGHRINNPASCNVATGAGFIPEGLERQKLLYGTERFDVETHARLRTDPRPNLKMLPMSRQGSFDGAQIQGLEVLLHFRGHYFVTHRFVESSGAVVESENAESKSVSALGTRVVFG